MVRTMSPQPPSGGRDSSRPGPARSKAGRTDGRSGQRPGGPSTRKAGQDAVARATGDGRSRADRDARADREEGTGPRDPSERRPSIYGRKFDGPTGTGQRSSGGLRADGTPRRPAPAKAKSSGTATPARARRIPPPPAVNPRDVADVRPAGSREPERWIDEGPSTRSDGPQKSRRRAKVPTPVIEPAELAGLVGSKRAKTLSTRLSDAAVAFASERYVDSRRMLRAIVEEAPGSVTARELLGLTQYRLGNWSDAAKHLEVYRQLSNFSVDQHPVLADCYRALRKYALVDELWIELRDASPSAELMVEGRIVVAGSLADRGKLADAVRELEKGWKVPKSPRIHHLRRAYALADLYERLGEIPKARSLMQWIAAHDSEFADVAERVRTLR